MCDWIEKEIHYITDADVIAPEYVGGEYETRIPGAIVPMRLRKMYTRSQHLYGEMQAILAENGLTPGEDASKNMIIDVPHGVSLQLHPIMSRAAALESAVCENLMGEYELWHHAAVVINKNWEVFYRTHEQEVYYQQHLYLESFFAGKEDADSDDLSCDTNIN